MLVYPRMKRIGTISCIGSIILLSSCTLTQQQPPINLEEAAEQLLAAQELDMALEQEQQTILEEAREAAEAAEKARLEAEARAAAEEKAREEAEALAKAKEEAEEKAHEEAEAAEEEARRKAEEVAEQKLREAEEQAAKSKDDNVPHLLNSRRKGKQELTKKEETITPTAEQQEAARKLMQEQKRQEEAKTAKANEAKKQVSTPEPAPVAEESRDLRSTLRMRRFAPPEEEISRSDEDEPLPNSVELRGFRSPTMKSKLPMNIDGKIIKED